MDTIMLFCEMNTKNGRKEGGREVVYQSKSLTGYRQCGVLEALG